MSTILFQSGLIIFFTSENLIKYPIYFLSIIRMNIYVMSLCDIIDGVLYMALPDINSFSFFFFTLFKHGKSSVN